jgi:hypothetical protein
MGPILENGGSGTVTSVTRGAGLLSSGDSISTTGTIAVNIGFSAGQIPTMDSDGNFALTDKLIKLNNDSSSSAYTFSNDTSLRVGHQPSGSGITNIMTVESTGDATFLGKVSTPEVCLAGDCKTAWPVAGSSGVTSLGAQTGSTQTFAVGTTGTAPGVASSSDTHTFNIPMAATAGVTAGLISKAEFDSFNSKGDITAVVTNSGSALIGGAANGASTLSVVVDGASLEIATNTIQVKNSGITNAKLATGIDASKITAGNLPTARIDTGVGANQLVKLDGSSRLPSIDGSLLTNLPVAGSVLSGFVAGSNTAVNNSDNVEEAIEKLQGQVSTRVPSSLTINGNALSGNIALTKSDIGLSNIVNIKDNFAATVAPTVSNDSGEGYSIGSRWIDVSADSIYICTDGAVGAAIWKEVSNLVSSGGSSKSLEVKTGNFTITASDSSKVFILNNVADSVVTLPSAAIVGVNFAVSFKHNTLFPVSIQADGAETIDFINSRSLIKDGSGIFQDS